MKRMPIYKWEITSSVKHGDGKTTSVGFDIWTVRMVMACTPFIEGLGSSIQMKTHAFCILCTLQLSKMQRMMGAWLCKASILVVLPAELGVDIMTISQHLSSTGIEKFSMQVDKFLPLGYLTGMTMQRVAYEATIALEVPVKHTSFGQDSAL